MSHINAEVIDQIQLPNNVKCGTLSSFHYFTDEESESLERLSVQGHSAKNTRLKSVKISGTTQSYMSKEFTTHWDCFNIFWMFKKLF